MIAKMKKGQGLVVQAINSTGQPISLVLPLADFAKAYDGPPTDPKVFEEQQKKLQEELQRRADEARKKLESQQGATASRPARARQAPQAGKYAQCGARKACTAGCRSPDSAFSAMPVLRRSRDASMHHRRARAVAALAVLHEHFRDLRMPHRLAAGVRQQILFGDIGDVFGLIVLGEQMIERLILVRPVLRRESTRTIRRYCRNRIDVEHDAAKRIQAVPDDLADLILGVANLYPMLGRACLRLCNDMNCGAPRTAC